MYWKSLGRALYERLMIQGYAFWVMNLSKTLITFRGSFLLPFFIIRVCYGLVV